MKLTRCMKYFVRYIMNNVTLNINLIRTNTLSIPGIHIHFTHFDLSVSSSTVCHIFDPSLLSLQSIHLFLMWSPCGVWSISSQILHCIHQLLLLFHHLVQVDEYSEVFGRRLTKHRRETTLRKGVSIVETKVKDQRYDKPLKKRLRDRSV